MIDDGRGDSDGGGQGRWEGKGEFIIEHIQHKKSTAKYEEKIEDHDDVGWIPDGPAHSRLAE
jgi:hypothetical protein